MTTTAVLPIDPLKVRHRFLNVNGLEIFYREAGPPDGPTLLLLHGFPSASHQYRRLIDRLSGSIHLIAPDYPGFGMSALPPGPERTALATFQEVANTMESFVTSLGLSRFFMYVFDFGAPIGFRLAAKHPEWIAGLISQNGNAYLSGLGPGAARLRPGQVIDHELVRASFSLSGMRARYLGGARNAELIAPDSWILDQHYVSDRDRADFQMTLLCDYPSNVELYPAWQTWLRTYRPPLLAAWGKNDQIFIEAGASAFHADVPDAEVHLLDGGHFALDEYLEEYSVLIHDFIFKHHTEESS